MDFLTILDSYMEENGLNKSTLSKLTGIPYTTIDGWYKKGSDNIKLSTVKKLSDALGVKLSYWNEGKNEKSPAPEGTEDKKISIEEMKQLLRALGFIGDGRELTEKDVKFLSGVFDLLDAWFSR